MKRSKDRVLWYHGEWCLTQPREWEKEGWGFMGGDLVKAVTGAASWRSKSQQEKNERRVTGRRGAWTKVGNGEVDGLSG